MGAMREMLRQGGMLPLNRDGAAGWVYDSVPGALGAWLSPPVGP